MEERETRQKQIKEASMQIPFQDKMIGATEIESVTSKEEWNEGKYPLSSRRGLSAN